MKKFFIFLILICLSITPIFVTAETDLNWENGLATVKDVDGTSATFTNITQSYSSGFLDIMPAVKKLIGSNEAITITVSGMIKAEYESPDGESSCRPAIRNRIGFENAQSWYDKLYLLNLNGAEPFFSVYGTNIARYFPEYTFYLKRDWAEFSLSFNANRNQIYCPVSSQWFFCFDSFDLKNPIKSISVKDVTITATVIENATPVPTVPATATPVPTPRAIRKPQAIVKSTPMPTPTPSPTPTPNWLNQPVVWDMSAMTAIVLSSTNLIVVSTGILYIALTIIAKKAKRK